MYPLDDICWSTDDNDINICVDAHQCIQALVDRVHDEIEKDQKWVIFIKQVYSGTKRQSKITNYLVKRRK